jgi:phosphatidylserine decarboxylase
MNTPFYVFMKLLPKNIVSRLFGAFTRLRIPLLSACARDWFANYYKLDMDEVEKPLSDYPNIAKLFIRRLKPGARPIATSEVVSPVDGHLSQTGVFDGEMTEMIQCKGKMYSLTSLLRDADLANKFKGGCWATIYLAPFNYHRIHSPIAGELISAHYCPGRLWPVNAGSVERVEGLFAINERLTSLLQTKAGGEMLVVKVGATNVGRISVAYSETLITNAGLLPRSRLRLDWKPLVRFEFEKGDDLGCFEMGSTVILVASREFRERNPSLFKQALGHDVRMGEAL